MTKQTGIIIVVIILIAILGGAAFMMFKKPASSNKNAEVAQPSVEQVAAQSPEPGIKGSIKNLLAAGKNVTCQMNYPEQNGSGEIYVSGNKFKGDFKMTVEGKEMVSHMLQDGTDAYVWMGGSAQGTKFKIDTLQKFSPPPGQSQAADLSKEVDMKCNKRLLTI